MLRRLSRMTRLNPNGGSRTNRKTTAHRRVRQVWSVLRSRTADVAVLGYLCRMAESARTTGTHLACLHFLTLEIHRLAIAVPADDPRT